jgi:hypothetical protein
MSYGNTTGESDIWYRPVCPAGLGDCVPCCDCPTANMQSISPSTTATLSSFIFASFTILLRENLPKKLS